MAGVGAVRDATGASNNATSSASLSSLYSEICDIFPKAVGLAMGVPLEAFRECRVSGDSLLDE